MSHKQERIPVEISRQVLSLGSEVYPLRNIARVQTIKDEPERAAACRRCLIAVAVWIILGIVAEAVLNTAWSKTTSTDAHRAISDGQTAVGFAVLALIALSIIRLIRVLRQPTLYVLILETAGAQHAAVVSTDKKELSGLVQAIMVAIDNPKAPPYHTHIEHNHYGDRIQQFGNQNVGKVSR